MELLSRRILNAEFLKIPIPVCQQKHLLNKELYLSLIYEKAVQATTGDLVGYSS